MKGDSIQFWNLSKFILIISFHQMHCIGCFVGYRFIEPEHETNVKPYKLSTSINWKWKIENWFTKHWCDVMIFQKSVKQCDYKCNYPKCFCDSLITLGPWAIFHLSDWKEFLWILNFETLSSIFLIGAFPISHKCYYSSIATSRGSNSIPPTYKLGFCVALK